MSYAGRDHELDPKPKQRDDQSDSPRDQVREIVQHKLDPRSIPSGVSSKFDTGTLVARAGPSLPFGKLLARP